jgi:hypothetical protein
MLWALRDFGGGDIHPARGALDLHNLAPPGDAFQLAATLWALGGRRRGGSLRRPWTEGRVLGTCAVEGCDATFIKKQPAQI